MASYLKFYSSASYNTLIYVMASLPQRELPVIDLSAKTINPSSSCWTTTCDEVTLALQEYGCFIALYDEVSLQLHNAIFNASQDLLDLPIEKKILNTLDAPGHSYHSKGTGIPLFERLSIENATIVREVERFTKLMWPSGNESFCENALMFSKAVAKLEETVMRMVAKTYGIEQQYELFLESKVFILKFNKYQRCQEKERVLGLPSHTDRSFMTIIHQQEEGKGLEVQTKDGEWIKVDYSPSSFVVMAGDAFTAWSNGRIEAPYHKVTMQGNKDRYSMVVTSLIRDVKIEVPQELVDEDHPLLFEPFYHYKYLQYHTSNNITVNGTRMNGDIRSYCGRVCESK